jgi:hypothetical protein
LVSSKLAAELGAATTTVISVARLVMSANRFSVVARPSDSDGRSVPSTEQMLVLFGDSAPAASEPFHSTGARAAARASTVRGVQE